MPRSISLLPREPLAGALVAARLAVGAVAAHSYLRGANWRIAMVVAVCLAGATTAKLRVDRLDGPHIETPVVAEISGRVVARESRTERRPRIVLDALRSDTLAAERLPRAHPRDAGAEATSCRRSARRSRCERG